MTKAPAVYWLTAIGVDVPAESEWLTGRELDKLEQLRFTKRRADWRLGRWAAKRAVCAFSRMAGKELNMIDVEIIAADDGAPELHVLGSASEMTVSISHCRDVGFAVLSPDGFAVGCDVEAVEPRSERFVSDYFTEREQELVHRAADRDRHQIMNLIWSSKESTLKALRRGLERDTRSVEVRLPSGGIHLGDTWKPLTALCSETQQVFYGWWKRDDELLFTVFCSSETEPPSPLFGGVKS
jgi:phosphopantetheinyl transferase (holo-ACP synthase)